MKSITQFLAVSLMSALVSGCMVPDADGEHYHNVKVVFSPILI